MTVWDQIFIVELTIFFSARKKLDKIGKKIPGVDRRALLPRAAGTARSGMLHEGAVQLHPRSEAPAGVKYRFARGTSKIESSIGRDAHIENRSEMAPKLRRADLLRRSEQNPRAPNGERSGEQKRVSLSRITSNGEDPRPDSRSSATPRQADGAGDDVRESKVRLFTLRRKEEGGGGGQGHRAKWLSRLTIGARGFIAFCALLTAQLLVRRALHRGRHRRTTRRAWHSRGRGTSFARSREEESEAPRGRETQKRRT